MMLWNRDAQPHLRATLVMKGVFGEPTICPAEWFSMTITSTCR